MQRFRTRELVGFGLLCVIVGGWFFGSGFERPWTIGHICTLIVFVSGLAICGYALVRR
jgi:hypothetical protein